MSPSGQARVPRTVRASRSMPAQGRVIKPDTSRGLFGAYALPILFCSMRGQEGPPRALFVLLSVGAIASVLALFLASPSARVAIRTPLVAKGQRGPLVAVPLVWERGGRATTLHRLALAAP